MIYLIESSGYSVDDKDTINYFRLLKIGYTEDNCRDGRFTAYKLHNPTYRILCEVPELTEEDEKNVQYKFRKYLYPEYGMEWFEYNKEIVDFFSDSNVIENIKSLPKCPVLEHRELTKFKKEVKTILGILKGIDKSIDIKYLYKEVFNRKLRSIDLVYEFLELSIDKNILDKCKYLLKCRETDVYCENPEDNQRVSEFLEQYQKLGTFKAKLRYLCEFGFNDNVISIVLDQIGEHDNIKSYYIALGPEKLRALSYNITRIRKELGIVTFSHDLLVNTIFSNFNLGDRISSSEAKNKLRALYESINYSATPKATDLGNYFEIKEAKVDEIIDGSIKKVRGILILNIKSEYQLIYNNLKKIINNFIETKKITNYDIFDRKFRILNLENLIYV